MKKILSASNSAEAHLVAEALRQDGMSASVQGEWGSLETPSVWGRFEGGTQVDTQLVVFEESVTF